MGNNPITDVHEEAFVDMDKNSRLKEIKIYVRKGHAQTYAKSDIWGSGKVKEINESFITVNVKNEWAEYFPMSPTDASLINVRSDVTTFVVPERVPEHTDYKVKLIGDYAFEDCTSNVEEVVVPSNVQLNYVGARAFVKTTKSPAIKSVFFVNSTTPDLATSVFDLHDEGVTDNYDEVTDGQTIYVKKSAVKAFKRAWNTLAEKITYKIPLQMGNVYTTFAREFDTDFSENNVSKTTLSCPNVIAFTSGWYVKDQMTENGELINVLKMRSINLGDREGDGTYIPAGTGVVLKTMDGPASTQNFYYQIHENELAPYKRANVVRPVTVKSENVAPTDGEKTNFIISGGKMHRMTVTRSIPAHKSYIQIPTADLENGAKVILEFDSDDHSHNSNAVTGIQEVRQSGQEVYHNLQGQPVSRPRRGIYIKNGKKIVVQ